MSLGKTPNEKITLALAYFDSDPSHFLDFINSDLISDLDSSTIDSTIMAAVKEENVSVCKKLIQLKKEVIAKNRELKETEDKFKSEIKTLQTGKTASDAKIEEKEKEIIQLRAKIESLEKQATSASSLPISAIVISSSSSTFVDTGRSVTPASGNTAASTSSLASAIAGSSPLFNSSSSLSSSSSSSSSPPITTSTTAATARDLSASGNGVGVAASAAVKTDVKADVLTYKKGDVTEIDSSSRVSTVAHHISPVVGAGATVNINVTSPSPPPKPKSCCLIL